MPIPVAVDLAKKQKEISVAEFFEKNKQILGFDTLTRSLLTCVKECVDNSLDCCEEVGILPNIHVDISKVPKSRDEYIIKVEDNGPGIVKEQIPKIFCKLLYGSRFHTVRQARGQQGIGVSASVLYGQLTTGRPVVVTSKISPDMPCWKMTLMINTKYNEPEILREELVHSDKATGTTVELVIKGKYVHAKQSVLEYLQRTAIVNPHANILLVEPDGNTVNFKTVTQRLPQITKEIKPHPEGIELGTLIKMCKSTEYSKFITFLANEFSRITIDKAKEICKKVYIDDNFRPKDITIEQANRVLDGFKTVRIMAPSVECLSPIGETLIKKGLRKELESDIVVTSTRPPSVYTGNPFIVECGILYNSNRPMEQPVEILRFANRVPLLYQEGDCVITKAISNIDWRRYGLEQPRGEGIPIGPAVILVHIGSTKIPFTSESKEAIANIDEIRTEIELAIRDAGRKLFTHLKKKERLEKMKEKEQIIRKILPLIANKCAMLLSKPVPPIEKIIAKIMNTVLILDNLSYNSDKKCHDVNIEIINYTLHKKSIVLRALVPSDAKIENILQNGTHENSILLWKLNNIPPMEKITIGFQIVNLDEEDYEENELYVEGIAPEIVSGAELWNIEKYEKYKNKIEVEEKVEEKLENDKIAYEEKVMKYE